MKKQIRFTDSRIGIKEPAWKVLRMLGKLRVPQAKDDWHYGRTSAWYNGRERGISLTYARGVSSPTLVVIWSECRNSDSLVVYTWTAKGGFFNPPTVEALTEKVYREGKFFHPDKLQEAANYIHGLVIDHLKSTSKAA